jgi:anion-transporting  ArsA/GET3 family ATPase
MPRPVNIFCGKGGVGKSTLSLAFALGHAARGRKVLLVTSHPLAELAVSLSLAGLKETDPVAAAHLFVVNIDPKQVLRDVILKNIGSRLLAETIFASRIYQSLVEVIPGLKEISFIARMRELSLSGAGPEAPHGFDRLVWDAPATGHFLRTLEVARNFESYLSGPLALLGNDVAAFLTDPANLVIHPIAIPEEMAIQETAELCDKLTKTLKIKPAGVICNFASPALGTTEEHWRQLRADFAAEAAADPAAAFVLDRLASERELFARLRDSVDLPIRIVPRKPNCRSDVDLLQALAILLMDPADGGSR